MLSCVEHEKSFITLGPDQTWRMPKLIDWLVGWFFLAYRPFETVFQSISDRLPERGRKRNPTAPTASAIGPCPTIIQTVGRPGTRSLPRTIAPPDHP